MSVQHSTNPRQRETNASFLQFPAELKVHGKLAKGAHQLAEKAHSLAPSLIFLLGAIFVVGAPAIIIGLVIYNFVSWLFDDNSHRRQPPPVYYHHGRPVPVRHNPPSSYSWFWNPFGGAPSPTHATVGGRRTGGSAMAMPPSSGASSWFWPTPSSSAPTSHATVGGRRTDAPFSSPSGGGWHAPVGARVTGSHDSPYSTPPMSASDPALGGGSHATVGGRRVR